MEYTLTAIVQEVSKGVTNGDHDTVGYLYRMFCTTYSNGNITSDSKERRTLKIPDNNYIVLQIRKQWVRTPEMPKTTILPIPLTISRTIKGLPKFILSCEHFSIKPPIKAIRDIIPSENNLDDPFETLLKEINGDDGIKQILPTFNDLNRLYELKSIYNQASISDDLPSKIKSELQLAELFKEMNQLELKNKFIKKSEETISLFQQNLGAEI